MENTLTFKCEVVLTSMLLKLLGLVDLVAAGMLALASTGLISARIIISIAGALILKGVIFAKDPVSKFDIVIGLYLLAAPMLGLTKLNILLAIYLGLKGIYSMF